MYKSILRKYARLAVKTGANVQKGQDVVVNIDVGQAEFCKYIVDEAYKAGARKVTVNWRSQQLTVLNYRHQCVKALSEVPEWEKKKLEYNVEKLPAMIHVESENPDGMKAINPAKFQKVNRKRMQIIKPYRDRMESRYQWTIVAVPSKEWAKKVFPDDTGAVAVSKLWDAILETVHITDDNDPCEAWKQHNKNFAARSAWLNEKKFDYVTYKSSNGTDFRCDLLPQGVWCGGGETTLSGVYFNPNMPTEEIFTSPKAGACSGKLVATKPLSYMGSTITDFWIEFENGKAVKWGAATGEELLGKIITMDETSGMLGELALVPQSSPINRQGILYYNTLFDENACCHVALGAGFNECVEGYENLTNEQIRELGVNDSTVHVDFMIGAPDLEIVGYKNGVATKIFENGEWAF